MFGDAEQRTGMADCFPSDWSPLELFWNATMHHETPAETLFGGETRSGDDGLLKRPTNSSLLRSTYAALCASPVLPRSQMVLQAPRIGMDYPPMKPGRGPMRMADRTRWTVAGEDLV